MPNGLRSRTKPKLTIGELNFFCRVIFVELKADFKNFAVITRKTQGAVEINFSLRALQQTLNLHPFDVGELA